MDKYDHLVIEVTIEVGGNADVWSAQIEPNVPTVPPNFGVPTRTKVYSTSIPATMYGDPTQKEGIRVEFGTNGNNVGDTLGGTVTLVGYQVNLGTTPISPSVNQ